MGQLRFLFAVDPSLTSTGWALFDLRSRKPLKAGVIAPPGSDLPLVTRLGWLQDEVSRLFSSSSLGGSDMLVCEGPAPLVLNPQSALKVERVRGVFEVLARERGMRVPGRINPRTLQSELLGMRGKQLPRAQVKAWAREVATRLFGSDLDALSECRGRNGQLIQDVIDALLIGALAISRLTLAAQAGIPPEEAFGSLAKSGSRGSSKDQWATTRAGGRGVRWAAKDLQKLLSNE